MSLLRRNIIANLAGRICTAVIGLVFVPIIVRLIGIESYGLVAFFSSVQSLFSLLDLGLSATITRELARLSAHPDKATEMRDMVRTLEICYWSTAFIIALCMLALTPFVVHWVTPQHLTTKDIRQAVLIMGAVMALQWPLSFYDGGLVGLQRQIASNAVSVSAGVVRQVGAVLILWLVSPTVQAFLAWQVLTSGLQTGVTASMVWRSLPPAPRAARFRKSVLSSVWQFAAGLTGTSIVSLGLGQMDKLVLSRLLSLEDFGYYSLAGVAAAGLQYLIAPFFSAAFPRFSQLIALGDADTLRAEYHRVAQFSSVLVLAAALVLMVFAPQILQLWMGDAATVSRTHLLVTVLAAATALNALSHVPSALQLAAGWTTLTLYYNAVALCVLAPATFLVAARFGALGAASVLVVLNAGYVFINVPLMHRRLLVGDQWRWYRTDVGVPLLASIAATVLWWSFVRSGSSAWQLLIFVAGASTCALLCAALATPATRHFMQAQLSKS